MKHSLSCTRNLSLWRHRALLSLGLLVGACVVPAVAAPLWFESGRPNAEARQALDILANAAAEGLDPQDYAADALRRTLAKADAAPLPNDSVTQIDDALTAAMELYLTELHFGRVDPRRIHENFAAGSGEFDPADYLRRAVAEHRLADAARQAAPALPLYVNLRRVLAQYRKLATDAALQMPLPALPARKLQPGQEYRGVAELTQRLIAYGDLPAATPAPPRYFGAVVNGVKAFQQRHGLEPDGVIGKGTFEQLNVTPATRVRQIELALERIRWTPLQQGSRMIVINVPEFVLRAYEVRNGQMEIKAAMKVIVGKALDTRTPLFDEEMRFVEFSPYWNVPPSIAREETVPKLRRDPAYFRQQDFEFVGNDGKVQSALSDANLDAVMRGQLRIRQRPGPKNALGDIKFVFPNNDNIYLHHTPAVSLFKRDRRDFSHGCIRVEDPVALAKFVFQDMPEWSESRILEAMAKGESKTIRLKEPLPVVIAYSTTLVKNDGKVYFFADIYGNDKLLDEELRKRPGVIYALPVAAYGQKIKFR